MRSFVRVPRAKWTGEDPDLFKVGENQASVFAVCVNPEGAEDATVLANKIDALTATYRKYFVNVVVEREGARLRIPEGDVLEGDIVLGEVPRLMIAGDTLEDYYDSVPE